MPKQALQVSRRQRSAIQSAGAMDFARAAKSENTRRAYQTAWRIFAQEFCSDLGYEPLPATPDVVVEFITWSGDRGLSTIETRLAAVSFAHRLAGYPDPTENEEVRLVMKGARRKLGKPPKRKEPLAGDELKRAVTALPRTMRGVRDQAILLVGYAGAFRRSELASLKVDDVEFKKGEMVITLAHSKTDQEGLGTVKHIPAVGGVLCPVEGLRRWLRWSGIKEGALFRKVDRWNKVGRHGLDDGSIARIVKAAAQAAGLDPRKFSGHSLRAGFVTAAADRDVPEYQIREVTGHRSNALQAYVRDQGRGGKKAIKAILSD